MILFSAPGSALSKIRAWLLTTPFDGAFAAPSTIAPIIVALIATDESIVRLSVAGPISLALIATDESRIPLTASLQ